MPPNGSDPLEVSGPGSPGDCPRLKGSMKTMEAGETKDLLANLLEGTKAFPLRFRELGAKAEPSISAEKVKLCLVHVAPKEQANPHTAEASRKASSEATCYPSLS